MYDHVPNPTVTPSCTTHRSCFLPDVWLPWLWVIPHHGCGSCGCWRDVARSCGDGLFLARYRCALRVFVEFFCSILLQSNQCIHMGYKGFLHLDALRWAGGTSGQPRLILCSRNLPVLNWGALSCTCAAKQIKFAQQPTYETFEIPWALDLTSTLNSIPVLGTEKQLGSKHIERTYMKTAERFGWFGLFGIRDSVKKVLGHSDTRI